jgi:HAD superfamily hydrolase (TIGR01509 family)
VTRAVLWDLDGTLVDSGDYHWRAWRAVMRDEGIDLEYRQFLDSFGQRNDRILATWLGPGVAPADVARIGAAKERHYRQLAAAEGLAPLPGAAEWIARLHHEGWRQAIASSAPADNVRLMLRALAIDRYVDATVTAEDVTEGKPDPQVFLVAAARLGATPARSIVVEDAAAGIEAARRGGMKCIGVSRTTRLAADLFAATLADLPPDAFDRVLGWGS